MLPTMRRGQRIALLQQTSLSSSTAPFVARRLCPQCFLRLQHSYSAPKSDEPPRSRPFPNPGIPTRRFPPRPPRTYVSRDRDNTMERRSLEHHKASAARKSQLEHYAGSARQRESPDRFSDHTPLSDIDRDVMQVSEVSSFKIAFIDGLDNRPSSTHCGCHE